MLDNNGISIRVDIDDLMDKLEAMKEDEYVTAELIIASDGYDSEMEMRAVNIEDDQKISYGTLQGIMDDFM